MTILAASAIRVVNLLSLSTSLKKITPLTLSVYSTISILFTYFIDALIGAMTFKLVDFIAIVIIILGILTIALKNLQALKEVRMPLILKVLSEILKGYLAYFALKHINTAMYTFLIAILTTLFILPFSNKLIGKCNNKKLKVAFIAQTIGVIGLITSNLLAKSSATLYMLAVPTTLVAILLLSYVIKKDTGNKPTKIELLGSLIVIAGLIIFSVL